jgi:hypothetical protein
VRQFLFLVRRDDAAWQAPCEEEQHSQGQKGACSGDLNSKRFGYIKGDNLFGKKGARKKENELFGLIFLMVY